MFQDVLTIFNTTVFKIFFFVVILFFLVFFSPSTVKAAFSGAPFLPTSKKVIRKALKLADLKQDENFFDLGSGTGRALIIAAREFGARAVGFEISTPLFVFSKINLFFRKVKTATVFKESLFKADLRSADVIFLFLTPRAFKKLEGKFNKELRPGTRVVAYSSPLLFWSPEKIMPISNNGNRINLYFYIKK